MPPLKRLTHIRACALIFLSLFFSLLITGSTQATTDFTLSPTSAGLGLTQGGSGAASTVTVVPTGGFTGSVSLSAATLPTGITISYGTNPVVSGTGSSALTFTASSSAALGASSITITGTSGSLVHTTVITLYVVGTKAFSIYGSGSSGTQTIGSVDSNFSMVSSFPGYTTTPVETGSAYVTTESSNWPYPGVWLADAPGFCYWISPQQSYTSSSSDPSGYFIFEQKFNLNGFDASTAAISGVYAADDNVTMYLNGVLKVGTAGGYATTRPFTISSGFCNGVNSLDLVVQNTSAASGLFWGITSATASTVTGGPSIATAASASSSPVTGTTTSLSVLGAEGGSDTGLMYTWATTGTPPAAVTYSANSTNAAKNTTAAFTKAGLYEFQVTVTDASAKTATSLVSVLVSQTDTSVVMTPAAATLATGSVRNFKASASDQFGTVMSPQPAWTWTAATGTITSAGVYTAPSSAGSDTVTATDAAAGKYAAAAVTINTTSSFTLSASPTSRSVNQGSTSSSNTITVAGASGFNGTVTLTASGLPTGVTVNYGTNPTSTSSSITFTATPLATVGTSTVTITGTSGSLTATTTIALTVVAHSVLTTISVSPSTASVAESLTQQFTATGYDQNGVALSPQPTFTWTATGDGTVGTSGLFTAEATTGTATVKAASGTVSGTAAATVVYPAPTVATAAAATPNPVTGATTNLSVLGAYSGGESNLTYTWTASDPSVMFSLNGTNAAKSTLATFSSSGIHTCTVTITDPLAESVTSSVAITVNQTLTSIAVTPGSLSLSLNGEQWFTGEALDQFDGAMTSPSAFTWSIGSGGVGSIGSNGVYTAGATAGVGTVYAASGSISATASVVVTATSPTIDVAASANPCTLSTGGTSALSVVGSDDGGEAGLVYTWAAVGTVPAPVTFSANGTNAAKSSSATFTQPGSYTLQVTITDPAGLSVTSSVVVTLVTPSAPTNFTAVGGNGQVLLNWTPVPGARGYTVYYMNGGSSAIAVSMTASGTSYTDTGLSNGTTYNYAVATLYGASSVTGKSSTISTTPQEQPGSWTITYNSTSSSASSTPQALPIISSASSSNGSSHAMVGIPGPISSSTTANAQCAQAGSWTATWNPSPSASWPTLLVLDHKQTTNCTASVNNATGSATVVSTDGTINLDAAYPVTSSPLDPTPYATTTWNAVDPTYITEMTTTNSESRSSQTSDGTPTGTVTGGSDTYVQSTETLLYLTQAYLQSHFTSPSAITIVLNAQAINVTSIVSVASVGTKGLGTAEAWTSDVLSGK